VYICPNITQDRANDEYNGDVDTLRALTFMLGLFAMLLSAGLGQMMASSKKLMEHPNKLIYLMCMCEGAACWHAAIELIGADIFIGYFKLNLIFADTTFQFKQ